MASLSPVRVLPTPYAWSAFRRRTPRRDRTNPKAPDQLLVRQCQIPTMNAVPHAPDGHLTPSPATSPLTTWDALLIGQLHRLS